MTGFVKIIAGRLKGKMLKVLDSQDLRPTPNRLRESLFSILQHDIKLAVCLDGFAGTGALGIEAYSRGASHVTFLEQHPKVFKQLQEHLKSLPTEQYDLIQEDCLTFLTRTTKTFDIIFLDPPFSRNYWQELSTVIYKRRLLNQHGILYMESALKLSLDETQWRLLKQGKTGDVYFGLYELLVN